MEAIGNNYSPDQVLRWGLGGSVDFMLLCQKPENIAPFYRTLTGLIERDERLRDAHEKSLARIERLFRFHFPG